MNNWVLDYLGKPWIVGANGPDAFDCWGLLEHIYKNQKGILLPRYNCINKESKTEVSNTIAKSICIDWKLLENPIDLCAVALSNLPNKFFHVGCYLANDNGYIVHTRKDFGAMIEPLDKIKLNWKYIKFYGLRNHNK